MPLTVALWWLLKTSLIFAFKRTGCSSSTKNSNIFDYKAQLQNQAHHQSLYVNFMLFAHGFLFKRFLIKIINNYTFYIKMWVFYCSDYPSVPACLKWRSKSSWGGLLHSLRHGIYISISLKALCRGNHLQPQRDERQKRQWVLETILKG